MIKKIEGDMKVAGDATLQKIVKVINTISDYNREVWILLFFRHWLFPPGS